MSRLAEQEHVTCGFSVNKSKTSPEMQWSMKFSFFVMLSFDFLLHEFWFFVKKGPTVQTSVVIVPRNISFFVMLSFDFLLHEFWFFVKKGPTVQTSVVIVPRNQDIFRNAWTLHELWRFHSLQLRFPFWSNDPKIILLVALVLELTEMKKIPWEQTVTLRLLMEIVADVRRKTTPPCAILFHISWKDTIYEDNSFLHTSTHNEADQRYNKGDCPFQQNQHLQYKFQR